MNRRGFILGAVLKISLFLGLMAALLFFTLDYIVEYGIELGGTWMVGARVKVDSVDLSLTSGKGVLNGITVSNPGDFSDDTALALKKFTFRIKPESFSQKTVVIDRVTVEGPEVAFEVNSSGKSNIAMLMDSIDRFLDSQTQRSEKSESRKKNESRKQYIVRRFSVNKGRISIKSEQSSVQVKSVPLPSLTLTNVGGSSGSVPCQLAKTVVSTFGRLIIDTASGRGLESYLEVLVKDRILDEAKDFFKKVF